MGWCLWPSPEGEGVVSNEGLALPDEEGAVGGPCLDAVLRQQPLRNVPPIASRSQLAVKPLLRGVKLGAVAHLTGRKPTVLGYRAQARGAGVCFAQGSSNQDQGVSEAAPTLPTTGSPPEVSWQWRCSAPWVVKSFL